jgi:hypothetical protein
VITVFFVSIRLPVATVPELSSTGKRSSPVDINTPVKSLPLKADQVSFVIEEDQEDSVEISVF